MKQQSARTAVAEQSYETKGLFSHSCPSIEQIGRLGNHRSVAYQRLFLISVLCLCAGISAQATVRRYSLPASEPTRPTRSTLPSTLRLRLKVICTSLDT